MPIAIPEVIARLADHAITAVFVNRAGEIVELLPMPETPTPEAVIQLGHSHKHLAFNLAVGRQYTEDEIRGMIERALEGFRLADAGLLGSGANCR